MGDVAVNPVWLLYEDTAEEAEAEPLVADDFTGSDAAAWDTDVWPFVRGGTSQISSNQGSQSGGSPANALTHQVVTDFELLVKMTLNASMGNPEIGWRIGSSIASGDPVGYVVQFGGSVQMYRISGYATVGASVSGSGLAGTTQWVRIRAEGTSHKVRWWTDGGAEPETWQIERTDANYSEGVLALRHWGGNAVLWDDYTVTDLVSTPANGSLRNLSAGHAIYNASPVFSGTDFTWTAWVYVDTVLSTNQMIEFTGGANFIILELNSSGNLQLHANTGTTSTGHTVTADTWYYLAATRTASGVEIYYATGVAALTKVTGTAVGTIPTGSSDFKLLDTTVGQIAAVKVWSAKLTQVEIEAERNSYAAVRTSNLWAEYRFDDGLSASDDSGNGRSLTFTGGVASGPAPPNVS